MEKIKLNISGNLVSITIPESLSFDKVEKQLRETTIKNYKLLKTLKFYQLMGCHFAKNQNMRLERIVELTVKLSSLSKSNNSKDLNEEEMQGEEMEKENGNYNKRYEDELEYEKKVTKSVRKLERFKIHYGNLKSGEKLTCDSNLLILGNTNPGSYVKSKKSIFIYGKAQGTVHAGSENVKNETSIVYLKEIGAPKIKIGDAQRTYCNTEELTGLLFSKKLDEIKIEQLSEIEVIEILGKMGIDLI